MDSFLSDLQIPTYQFILVFFRKTSYFLTDSLCLKSYLSGCLPFFGSIH